MTVEIESPATGATPEGGQATVPQASEVSSNGTEKAAAQAASQPEASATQEPDYDSWLQDEQRLERLLQHPKAQQRLKTVRDSDIERRAGEKAEAMLRQRDAEYAAQRTRTDRMKALEEKVKKYQAQIADDPTSPAAQVFQSELPELNAEWSKLHSETLEAQVAQKLTPALRAEERGQFYNAVAKAVMEMGVLTQDEVMALNPYAGKYQGDQGGVQWLMDVLAQATKNHSQKEAQKIARELAKVEAQALLQQQRGQEMEKQEAPTNLPQGATSATAEEFAAEYAAGRSNDHARMNKQLKEWGIL